MNRCHNCHADVPSHTPFRDWEALCPDCGRLTWIASGDDVQVAVTKVLQFGVFVELGDQVEGLIHISELSDRLLEHSSDVVSTGDSFIARVVRVDHSTRKISLSRRRAHAG